MPETFSYPRSLVDNIQRERQRRMIFWTVISALVWLMCIWGMIHDPNWFALVLLIGWLIGVAIIEGPMTRFGVRTVALADQTIEIDGSIARQLASTGSVIAEIDLDAPFKITYPYHAAGNAIYAVTQVTPLLGRSELTFSSRIDNAEHLVRDIFRHHEWSPGADAD